MHSKEKIKKIRERALLREYLQLKLNKILKEDDYSDYDSYYDYGGGGGGGGGYTGKGFGSFKQFFESDFAKLFGFSSIKNSVDTAIYGIKGIATKVGGEIGITAKALFYTLVPLIEPGDYPSIIDMAAADRTAIEQKLSSLDSKYASVLKENAEIFNNPDFNLAFFLAAPGAVIGNVLVDTSIGAATDLYDSFVGKDNNREGIGRDLDKLFSGLMPGFGYNPNDKNQKAAFEKELFSEIKADYPELSESDIRSVLGHLGGALREQNVNIKNDLANKIDKFLDTEQGQTFIQSVKYQIQQLSDYLKSPIAQQNIERSPMISKGQQILVDQIVNKAREAMNKFNINFIKSNYSSEIDKFFKEKGIEASEEKERLINDPKFIDEITKLFKSVLKKPYLNQLDELEKLNPTELRNTVQIGKKAIEDMATHKA
jgi:hypothetical protein